MGRRGKVIGRGLAWVVAAILTLELGLRVAGAFYRAHYDVADVQPGDIKVLCLGESSTFGLWVDRADSYPAQLQELLRAHYHRRVTMIVPPHIGQNTSQIADRVPEYMERFHPQLVIVMSGANNEWALRESHLSRFLDGNFWVRAQIALDGVRVYRLARYLAFRISVGAEHPWVPLERQHAVYGAQAMGAYPPPDEVYQLALANQGAFKKMWRADMRQIVDAVRSAGAQPLLMTYHLPGRLGAEDFVELAAATHAPLVRNDLAFAPLLSDRSIERYVFPKDHWHPNAAGYGIIARQAFEVITRQNLLHLGE